MITDAPNLSAQARKTLENPENEIFLSAASCWEIAIKAGLKRIRIKGSIEQVIPEHMQKLSIQPLPIQTAHALLVASLPLHHRDPFDRMLIAQSKVERLPILTPDPAFESYDVRLIW